MQPVRLEYIIVLLYLFSMCIEVDRHFQQGAPAFDSRQEVVHAFLEDPRFAVYLGRIAFSRLC